MNFLPKTNEKLHVHFDCYSGAAGDMLLASLIDASEEPELFLKEVKRYLDSIPELKGEFDLKMSRVLRGSGCIAGNKVDVMSKYQHRSAPVPTKKKQHDDHNIKNTNLPHDHKHAHKHSQDHSHHHSHGHNHNHGHKHNHDHHMDKSEEDSSRVNNNDDKPANGHDHTHKHGHSHEHSHGHKHNHNKHLDSSKEDSSKVNENVAKSVSDHDHKHSHDHSHHHSHGHNHNHGHKHNHNEKEASKVDKNDNKPAHGHAHDHFHNHGHSHGHSHSHVHSQSQGDGPLRNLPEITSLIRSSTLIPKYVQDLGIKAFTELAKAEAYTHGSTIESVHFHEVGAVDSIVDTFGVLISLHLMNITTVSCSRLPMGEGKVWTSHGMLPVPAPATLRLLVDMPVCDGPSNGITGELVTPTAAALLKVLVNEIPNRRNNKQPNNYPQTKCPSMIIRSIGIGAGTKNFDEHPNILRAIIGDCSGKDTKKNESSASPQASEGDSKNLSKSSDEHNHSHSHGHSHDHSHSHHSHDHNQQQSKHEQESPKIVGDEKIKETITEPAVSSTTQQSDPGNSAMFWKTEKLIQLEANIDDTTPEILAYTMEKLLSQPNCLDVWIQPILMKKGRAAHTLHCLCRNEGGEEEKEKNINNERKTTTISKLLSIIFKETTTLGVRVRRDIERASIDRFFVHKVKVSEDERHFVNVKVGFYQDMSEKVITSISPEFEDCKKVAISANIPLKTVMDRARNAIQESDLY